MDMRLARIVIGLGLFAFLGAARAAEVDWDDPAGGTWGVQTNWAGDVKPGGLDAALFNLGQSPAYTVALDFEETVGRVQVLNDDVVIDLGGYDLNLALNWFGEDWYSDNTFEAIAPLMVGRGTVDEHHTGVLTVQGGGTLTGDGLLLGGTSGSSGIVKVQGVGTRLQINTAEQVHAIVAAQSPGQVHVLGGATAHFSGIRMGRRAGTGTVIVEGAVQDGEALHRSTLTYGSQGYFLGHLGRAHLYVRDGALLSGTGYMYMSGSSREAFLTVDNATAQIGTSLQVGRGTADATVDVINGGLLEIGTVFIQPMNALNPGTAYIAIDGEGSRMTVASTGYVGGSTGEARGPVYLTVSDGGEADFDRLLRVYGQGKLVVDNGAILASDLDAQAGSELILTLHTGEFGPAIRILNRDNGNGNAGLDDMTLTLALADGFFSEIEETFQVLQYEGTLTGGFLGRVEDAVIMTDEGYGFRLNYGDGSDGVITLTTVIPEPGAAALLLLGGLLLCARRRRGLR